MEWHVTKFPKYKITDNLIWQIAIPWYLVWGPPLSSKDMNISIYAPVNIFPLTVARILWTQINIKTWERDFRIIINYTDKTTYETFPL